MEQYTIDWLKLHIAVNPGVRICSAITYFGSASQLCSAPRGELLQCRYLDEETVDRILGVDEKQVSDIAAVCDKYGWSIITPDDPEYPRELKGIKDFPFVLFAEGDIGLLGKYPKISVVGTRTPGEQALMATYLLTCSLTSMNVVTVSGGALGIDAASHEGALTGNGGTIAVLGCGLGSDYLPENSFMRKRIAKNGLLLSEFSPFVPPSRYTFPRRNRIISALSEITVVAESAQRGGSLITAEYAFKQHRKVFCFAEDIVSSPGCSELLKKGAEAFRSPGDLINSCRYGTDGIVYDKAYMYYDLHNDGIHGVHIIKHSTMTADSFAVYNGITPAEARRVLGNKLKNGTPAKKQETQRRGSTVRQPEKHAERPRGEEKAPDPAAVCELPPETGREEKKKVTVLPGSFSENARAVYAVLDDQPQYFDEIQHKTFLSSRDVMSAITELELEDLVALHPGDRVSRI